MYAHTHTHTHTYIYIYIYIYIYADTHTNAYTLMEIFTLEYSLKNIPHPTYHTFQLSLTEKIVDFIKKEMMEDLLLFWLYSSPCWI